MEKARPSRGSSSRRALWGAGLASLAGALTLTTGLAAPVSAAPARGGHPRPPRGYTTPPCPSPSHDRSAYLPGYARTLADRYVVRHYQRGRGTARALATEIDTERDAAGQRVCVYDVRVHGSSSGTYSVHVTRTRKPYMAVWWVNRPQ
ncbi:MAG: hypothetical protein M0Z69_09940 [Actinomycetota bacterium]|nr:hypothetical protein [Actinomycetota bacterium]